MPDRRMVDEDRAIIRGTGNMFADLGYPDAEKRHAKVGLAYAINVVIGQQRLTRAAAAERLAIDPPMMPALAQYELDGFSVARLITFLTVPGRDVEIAIRLRLRSRRRGKVSVVAI